MKNIENPFTGNLGAHGDGRRIGVELEVRYGVSVRCEDHLAPLVNGKAGEIGVEVLATGKAVDLDRDTFIGAGRKNRLPPRLETGPLLELTTPRVGQDVNARGCDRAE